MNASQGYVGRMVVASADQIRKSPPNNRLVGWIDGRPVHIKDLSPPARRHLIGREATAAERAAWREPGSRLIGWQMGAVVVERTNPTAAVPTLRSPAATDGPIFTR